MGWGEPQDEPAGPPSHDRKLRATWRGQTCHGQLPEAGPQSAGSPFPGGPQEPAREGGGAGRGDTAPLSPHSVSHARRVPNRLCSSAGQRCRPRGSGIHAEASTALPRSSGNLLPTQAHLDSLRPRQDPTAPLPRDRTEARRARKHHNGSAQRRGQSGAAPLASLCSGSGERRVSLETGAPLTAASSNPAPGHAQTRPTASRGGARARPSMTSQGPLPCPHSVPPSVPAPLRVLVFYLSPRERGDLARPSPPGTLTSMSSRGWWVSL